MPTSWRLGRTGSRWGLLLAVRSLIVLSSQVKLPSLLALGFVAMRWRTATAAI